MQNQVICWIGAKFFAFTSERLDFPYALSTLSLRATFPPIAWKKKNFIRCYARFHLGCVTSIPAVEEEI